jgi:hypothetical protein
MGILTSQNPDIPEGLKQRLSVRIQRISVELLRSSYEEGSRQAKRPSGPQRLTILPTRLRLDTTLRKRALQVKSLKCGVCMSTFTSIGVFIGPRGSSTNLAEAVTRQVVAKWPSHMASWPMSLASTDFLHRHSLPLVV